MGRIYEVWPTFHGSVLVLHPPLKGKSTVILPWRAIFKNFSPTKVREMEVYLPLVDTLVASYLRA